ncbi:hypothetical protein N1031_18180 [Herbiconiux moechotypicola]|uniref:Lipoprotein n=1 Tax=Herbiconiux moechotypicola TaxID=637393 RepID=A0ABP5QKC6_9MICO|nr:hypothetical protein [Herbiconiux moechotypicola]MCS5731688.1 hypothetical protein [Herbiconiux moechotypicola]
MHSRRVAAAAFTAAALLGATALAGCTSDPPASGSEYVQVFAADPSSVDALPAGLIDRLKPASPIDETRHVGSASGFDYWAATTENGQICLIANQTEATDGYALACSSAASILAGGLELTTHQTRAALVADGGEPAADGAWEQVSENLFVAGR